MIEDLQGERRATAFMLGPLSASEHTLFLETLVGTGIADGLVRRLYKGSEGNPFFTKELVRALVDSGGIVKDDSGAWNLSAEASLASDALPATIQKAVEKRISRLPEDLRDILSVASVIGTSFDPRDLASLTQSRDIDDAIDRLVEEGLIEEERESRGGLMSFSSGVVHDVLYAGLSPRKRRSLHRRSAELLETRYAGRLERVLPQLVQHFFQGDVPDKTVEYGLRLAKSSLETFSVEDATRSASTALTFLDADWEGPRVLEGDARLLLAKASRMAGDLETARREAAAASRIFEQEKGPDEARRGAPPRGRYRLAGAAARGDGAMAREGPRRCPRNRRRKCPRASCCRSPRHGRTFSATTSARTRTWRKWPRSVPRATRRRRGPYSVRWPPRGGAGEPGQRHRSGRHEDHRRVGDRRNGLRDPADDGHQRPLVAVALREVGPGGSGTPLCLDAAP